MTTTHSDVTELAGALDAVLASPAEGTVARFLPGMSGVRMAAQLARHPRIVATRGRQLGAEVFKVVTGASTLAPAGGDRRFRDAAWTENPVLRRVVQTYLAGGRTAEALVEDAHLSWRDTERMRFIVTNLVEAAAPSNNPLLNPQAWKASIDTGGLNAARGTRNFLGDMRSAPRIPAMVDESAFEVGGNVAITPGAVVHRTEVCEIIQYTPQTQNVRQRPVLIVPPTINKYYVLDLAPGRSMVEYLVQQGQQVFVISWRNPDARHLAWDLDTYGQAILDALTVVETVSRSDRTVLTGICSGGILASLLMGYLAAVGQLDRIAGFGLAVTMLDQGNAGAAGAMIDDATASAAIAASGVRGYLDGRSLAELFAWLRPSDLVWNYWVNNYLLGKKPPAFDILYWNSDTTRMTAGLHRDFLQVAISNAIANGTAELLGVPVDLSKVDTDSYVVAAVADHICPWETCYRTTQLLGGDSRFVLSSSGHIAAMVNPPSNPKASFFVADDTPPKATQWKNTATKQDGSWWPDFDNWLAQRSGPTEPAPLSLGSPDLVPLDCAPGSYVLDR